MRVTHKHHTAQKKCGFRKVCTGRDILEGQAGIQLTGEVSKHRILCIYTRKEIKDILLGKKAELYAHFGATRAHIA